MPLDSTKSKSYENSFTVRDFNRDFNDDFNDRPYRSIDRNHYGIGCELNGLRRG
jgi:hypothetical protein